jgi:WD40 repeat protein
VIPGVKNRRILARIQLDTNHDGSILFHPDAFPGQDGVSLFDVEHGDLITTLDGHPGIVSCCTYQPDQNELYTGGKNGFLCVWNCQDTFLYRKPDAAKEGAGDEEVDEWSDND